MNETFRIGACLLLTALAPRMASAADAAGATDEAALFGLQFDTGQPEFKAADTALNEASTHLGDMAAAEARIATLLALAKAHPTYPHRADLFYYVGLNAQMLRQYGQAAAAFASALKANPAIAAETPINAYLKLARRYVFIRNANIALVAVLALVLVPALARLARADAAALPWVRLFAVYAVAALLWTIVVFLLPRALGPAKAGLENFPKPTLSNFRLGQYGDAPLRALWLYGIGAALATLPVIAAAARWGNGGRRAALTSVGAALAIACTLGLFAIRYLYPDAKYHAASQRLIMLSKSIDTAKDVPDEMLPLYHKRFANEVLKARGQAGK